MKDFGTYSIPLASLQEGEHAYSFELRDAFAKEYAPEDLSSLDVDADVRVTVRHQAYRIDIELTGTLQTPCHRCLEPVEVPVEEDYSLVVTYGDETDESGLGESGTPENPDRYVLAQSEPALDLAPIIRDTLLLAIPMRCVHDPGECNPDALARISDQDIED